MFLAELIGEIVAQLLLGGLWEGIMALVGWIYLWTWFRNRIKVKFALARHFDRSYAVAGRALIFGAAQILLALFALLLLFGIGYVVVTAVTG